MRKEGTSKLTMDGAGWRVALLSTTFPDLISREPEI